MFSVISDNTSGRCVKVCMRMCAFSDAGSSRCLWKEEILETEVEAEMIYFMSSTLLYYYSDDFLEN